MAATYAGPEAHGYRSTDHDRQHITPVKQPPGHVSTGDGARESHHDSCFMDDTVNWRSSHARQGNGVVADPSPPGPATSANSPTATDQGNDPFERATVPTPIAGGGEPDPAGRSISPIMITRRPGGQGALGGGSSCIAVLTLTSPATAAMTPTRLLGNRMAAGEVLPTRVDWAALMGPTPGVRSPTPVTRGHSPELFGRDTHSPPEVRCSLQSGTDTGTGTPATWVKGAGMRDSNSNSSMGMSGDDGRGHGRSSAPSGSARMRDGAAARQRHAGQRGPVGLNQSGAGRGMGTARAAVAAAAAAANVSEHVKYAAGVGEAMERVRAGLRMPASPGVGGGRFRAAKSGGWDAKERVVTRLQPPAPAQSGFGAHRIGVHERRGDILQMLDQVRDFEG